MRRRVLGLLGRWINGRADQQNNFTARRSRRQFNLRKPRSHELFVYFRQLTSNYALALAKDRASIFKCVYDPMRSLINDERHFQIRKLLEPGPSRRTPRGKKSYESELRCWKRRGGQSRDYRRRTGNRYD